MCKKLENITFTKGYQKVTHPQKSYQNKRKRLLEHPIRKLEMESSDHQAKKNDKGGQKVAKRAQKFYKWKLIDHFYHCN